MKRARQRSQTGDTGQLLTQLDCWVPQKGLPVWPPGPELLCGCEQAAQPACLQSKVCAGTLVSRPVFPSATGAATDGSCLAGKWLSGHGKRGQFRGLRNTPYDLISVQPLALSLGLRLQAQWSLSRERPKFGGTGGNWETS